MTRRAARRQAIDILYEADVVGADPRRVLDDWGSAGEEIDAFARGLVEGVADHQQEIDALLRSHAEHWTVDRMASVDRVILRVATYELLHRPDVPPAAAIDEAVQAAKELSTEDSGRFVNGLLGRIARDAAGEDDPRA